MGVQRMSYFVSEGLLDNDAEGVVASGADSLPCVLVDQRGARCPVPILAVKRALRGCETGQVVELLASDPDSARDIPHFVRDANLTLVSSSEFEGVFRFSIRKERSS